MLVTSLPEQMTAAATAYVAPHAARIDREDAYPRDIFRALARQVCMAPSVPLEYGGAGADLVQCFQALAALAAASPSVALSWGAHAFLCAHNLALLGSETQKRRHLPQLARYERIGAFAITEPGAGSDATSVATRAVPMGDAWALTGTKTFITNGAVADVALVFARTPAGVSLFLVEAFGATRHLAKLGFRGSPTSEMVLDGCRGELVGEDGAGARLMMRCLDVERTLLSAISVGMLESLLQVLRAAAPPHPSQGFQELVAETAAARHIARTLGEDAARRLEAGERVTVPASVTKLYGAEALGRLTGAVLDRLGFQAGPVAERLYRDAKLLSIGAGTSEIQKLILAREALRP